MTTFTVVYDACVLYPAPLRDLLMRLALKDLVRARWSERILDEMQRAILSTRRDLAEEKIVRMRNLMNSHVRDAVVTGFERFEQSIDLPDLNDRHVVAAAIRCQAQVIVTFNLKDFPMSSLEPLGLDVQHPDDFLEHLLDLLPQVVLEAVREQRLDLKNPPYTVEDHLEAFAKQSLPKTVEILRSYSSNL